jgi:signal transduction histidine kinase/CheY-like chemotaxis protein
MPRTNTMQLLSVLQRARHHQFTRRLLGLGALSFCLLIIAGAGAIFTANRAADAEGWVEHSMQVRRDARTILVQLLNAETGQRGYLLTANEAYLEPYVSAVNSLEADYHHVTNLTADNPTQQEKLAALKMLIDSRVDELKRSVGFMQQGQRAEALAVVTSGRGKELMDRIRADLDKIFAVETGLLEIRQARAVALRRWVLGLIGVCLLTAMGLALTLARSTLHHIERLENEVKLRRDTEDTLRQAQKLEAVGQLTGGIAHDFNNLLTIIMGNLDTLHRRVQKKGSHFSMTLIKPIDSGLQACKSAAQLTQGLLAFSRRQTLAPTRLDLNRLVSGMSELLRRTLGEAIAVEITLAGGLWPTFADANQVESALVNLTLNARDAMPNGGLLTIETANAYLDDAYARRFGDVAPGQYVLLSVTDTGSGIAADVLEEIFEPFFTTKSVGEGSGLGLAMVHGFVKQSGGHIRIYSEIGQGTTAKIYLPRDTHGGEVAAVPAENSPSTEMPLRAQSGETVLIVEDNDGVREYATAILAELGYRVLGAPDAVAALEILDTSPQVDLLFTDVVLPGGINGRFLADRVREKRPDLPVLFATGYTQNAIVHQGRLDANVHLLSKPYTQQDVARKVRELIGRKC